MADAAELIAASLVELFGAFTSERRLYAIEGEAPFDQLLVEQFSLKEALNQPWLCRLLAVSLDARLDIHAMSGRRVDLLVTLPEGTQRRLPGIVLQARRDAGDGSWGRYVLTVRPAWALLMYTRASRVFQEKRLVDIVDSILGGHPLISWRWSADIGEHLARSPFSDDDGIRSCTTQFNETDAEFIDRLLAEEGIVYRFETDQDAPSGQTVVFVADTPSAASCPEDPSSAAAGGVRYHRDDPTEPRDTIQALGAARTVTPASATLLSWDYKTKRAIATQLPGLPGQQPASLGHLEFYDAPGAYAFSSHAKAERAALLVRESVEARMKRWFGRSTVRTFTPGCTVRITASPLDQRPGQDAEAAERNRHLLLTQVVHHGINNLPRELGERLRARKSRLLEPVPDWVSPELRTQAGKSGYANAFEASRRSVPWRRPLTDDHGERLNLKPTAPGPMEATVCDARGSTTAQGADELHMDRLGRIRIRFDFQAMQRGAGVSPSSTWVRMAQRHAGAGMGLQLIPRIGQRVLVDFIEGDIDRPIVIAALYGGKGEGGIPATPGGQGAAHDRSVFQHSKDTSPAGQGNLTGGHSPAWHGASPEDLAAGGQRNAAALSGFKTKEFGGDGYNQLVFDDTDRQLRLQFGTTQHATWLTLGHLIHSADNHRGSFRGQGWELRTDAYGAIRADSGVLLTTYRTEPHESAGDNAAGLALFGQLKTLTRTFWQSARTHETVEPSGWLGTTGANRSVLSSKQPPHEAMHTVLKGMVDRDTFEAATSDAQSRNTKTAQKVPHVGAPIVTLSARAGLVQVAGQDLQWSAGENITVASGQDVHLAVGGAARIHTGQAIGILGGAVSPGTEAVGTGVTLVAAHGDVDLQAQSDTLQIAARDQVDLASKEKTATFAAAKRIVLATAGGASLTIENGNITLACPGTLTVHAATKSFVGPETYAQGMNRLAQPARFDEHIFLVWPFDESPVVGQRFELVRGDGSVIRGRTDSNGDTGLQKSDFPESVLLRLLPEV